MFASCMSVCTFSISVVQMVKQDNCHKRQLSLLCLKMQLPLQLAFRDCFEIVVGHFHTNSCRTVANVINQKFGRLLLLVHVLKVHQRKWPISDWTKRQGAWTSKGTQVWQALHKDHGDEGSLLAQHPTYHLFPLTHKVITKGEKEKKSTCCEAGEETWEGEVPTDAHCKSTCCRFLKYKTNWWRSKKRTVLPCLFLAIFPWWEWMFSET